MRTSNKRAPGLGALALLFANICALTLFSSVVEAKPTISGTPKTTFGTHSWYSFQPTARDPAVRSSTLRYTIVNKPSWAKFSTRTGRLEGATPLKPGTWSNIRISVTSRTGTASLPAFSLQIVPKKGTGGGSSGGGSSGDGSSGGDSGGGGSETNRAPVVSGTPATSITAGSAYSFRPSGSDPEGRTLTWSITNRPSWASFNTSTGALTGTPTASHVGTYSNITIAASDGTNRTALRAFNIAVTSAGSNNGSATLSWTPPTTTTNGSALTDLAGYRIYYGTSASSLSKTVQVNSAGMTSYVLNDLAPATYYFAIRAYTTSGTESEQSNVVSKVIR